MSPREGAPGNHSDALVAAEGQHLRVNPNVEAAQRGLGYAYLRASNFKQAENHFRSAGSLDSSDPQVYFYCAELMQQNHPEAAGSEEFMRDLERAIQLNPRYADAYHLLGFGLMRKREYAGAEQNIRHAVELSPRDETNQLSLAVVLLNEHKTKEGMKLLTAVSGSANIDLAHQASEILASAGSVEFRSDDASLDNEAKPSPVDGPRVESASPAEERFGLDQRPLAIVSGKIVSIDCSANPAAVLTMFSSGKTYYLHVADREKLLLIRAGKFSCDWKDIKASAYYHDGGDKRGDLVSLELR